MKRYWSWEDYTQRELLLQGFGFLSDVQRGIDPQGKPVVYRQGDFELGMLNLTKAVERGTTEPGNDTMLKRARDILTNFDLPVDPTRKIEKGFFTTNSLKGAVEARRNPIYLGELSGENFAKPVYSVGLVK